MGRRSNCRLLPRNTQPGTCLLAWLAGLSLVLTAVRAPADEGLRKSPAAPMARPTPQLLRDDQRLQATLTVDLVKPTLQDILDWLCAATGLKIIAADDIPRDRLAFWSLSVHKIPAWMIMTDLQEAVVQDGRWECQGDGWRLTGVVAPPIGVVAPPIQAEKRDSHNRNRQALLLSAGALQCLFLALLLQRRTTKSP